MTLGTEVIRLLYIYVYHKRSVRQYIFWMKIDTDIAQCKRKVSRILEIFWIEYQVMINGNIHHK